MNHSSARDLGQQVRLYRRQKNLTQQELAAALDVSRHTVLAIENGRDGVSLGTFLHALHVLDVPFLVGEQVARLPLPLATQAPSPSNEDVLAHLFPPSAVSPGRGPK